jgi:hypothetical protein
MLQKFLLRNPENAKWIEPKYYAKWIPFVETMTLNDCWSGMPLNSRSRYDIEKIDMTSKVVIPQKFTSAKVSSKRYLTSSSGKGDGISRQKLSKTISSGKSYVSTMQIIRDSQRTVGSGRLPKYPEEEKFMIRIVREGWESGNPISKPELFISLMREFGPHDKNEKFVPNQFCSTFALHSGNITSALSQWVSRRLQASHWSIRAESVSQKVPVNWFELALTASAAIKVELKDVEVLINADEVFVQFYARDTDFIVPTGTKRVGSNIASDAKKGCTYMASCEMFSSQVFPPFIVMTGTHSGTLARKFATWRDEGGDAAVCFQPSHWMDMPTAMKYLDFIRELFPLPKKVGLIWDAASSHLSDTIKDYAESKSILLSFIPAGLTSIMQVCDLYSNKPIKEYIKKRFRLWKIKQSLPAGSKYKVDRKDIIEWIEEAVSEMNETTAAVEGKIAQMFTKLGQDPRDKTGEQFLAHLSSLSENCIYKALLESQTAEILE